MSGKTVINLRCARKAKIRDQKRKKADANAAKFGRSKSEVEMQQTASKQHETHLDGHKRDP